MTDILLIMFAAILTENFIFSKFYGICPFLGVSEKPSTALGMGMAVTFVMTVSGAATYLVYTYALVPLHLEYLKTIAFILVIASLVQFIEMFLKKNVPSLYGCRLYTSRSFSYISALTLFRNKACTCLAG